jgi:DNA-binding GntR family transcriptional regulator
VQQVYRVLKQAILNGQLKPGEKLVESRLAAALQTSRSPVREALRLLCAEQLTCETGDGIRVLQPSWEDFRQLYELRAAIESMGAKLAADRWEPAHISELERIQAETVECVKHREMDRLLELNSRFHACIMAASGNRRFERIFEEVSTLIHFYCRIVLQINRQQTNIVPEHGRILEALKKRDATAAYSAMHDHILRDLAVIESALSNGLTDEA